MTFLDSKGKLWNNINLMNKKNCKYMYWNLVILMHQEGISFPIISHIYHVFGRTIPVNLFFSNKCSGLCTVNVKILLYWKDIQGQSWNFSFQQMESKTMFYIETTYTWLYFINVSISFLKSRYSVTYLRYQYFYIDFVKTKIKQ